MTIPWFNLTIQHKILEKEIEKSIKEVFKHCNFRMGEEVKKFEEAFAKYCGSKYCIGVGSGYDAILLSLEALGVGLGDEVITVPNTFISTVTPILRLGAKPVFVDINPQTHQMDIEKLQKAITKKTKVILPVHLYGIPCQMDKIMQIARKYSLWVVEDACQAHGSIFRGKKCGSFGAFGAFSFYPTKNIGAPGEGGAVVTNSKKLYQKVWLLHHMGERQRYKHEIIGYNSHLDSIIATVLLIKLKYLENWNKKRRELAKLYGSLLLDLPIILPPEDKSWILNYYVYVIRTNKREKLMQFLKENGVGTAIHYPIPLHLQKALKKLGYKKGDFPIAEKLSKEILSLPMFPELSKKEVSYVCAMINKFFEGQK